MKPHILADTVYMFIFHKTILIGVKKNEVKNVEKLFEEVKELLEQMDLEAREQPGPDKTKYCNRVKSYEKEVQKLEQELVYIQNTKFIHLGLV